MNRHPGFAVDEIRGRLLHEALLEEGRREFDRWLETDRVPPAQEPPSIPHIAKTDTGSMRAIIVSA